MGDVIAWVLIGSIVLTICVGILCLRSCEGKLRICLFWDTVVFLIALALHLGGNAVLDHFGLAWRSLPGSILPTILLGSSLTWILLALCCFWYWEDFYLYKTIVGLFGTASFLIVLWMGLFAVAVIFSGEERIVEHQGRTFVEVCDTFPNEYYSYYEYRGSLVRGTKTFHGSGRYGFMTGSEEWPIDG